MNGFLSKAAQAIELFLLALAVCFILFFFILWRRGAFSGEKASKIGAILKGEYVYGKEEKLSEEELKNLSRELKEKGEKLNEEAQRKTEEFKQKELDLEMAGSVLSVIKKDLEEREVKVKEGMDKLALKPKPEDENKKIETNLAIFNKMQVDDIVKIIKDWGEKDIRKYLVSLKPSKASEVISALSKEATFGKSKLDKIFGENE